MFKKVTAVVLAALVSGAVLAAQDTAAIPAPVTADGKRHDATILSIEIVSPLPGFASVAPDAVFRQLDPLFELAQSLVARHGGVATAVGGSAITALFDAATCDNDAAVACRAALAVKSIIESESAGSVRIRAGVDSGEVIVRYRRHGQTERVEVAGAALQSADRLVQSLRRGLLALTERTRSRAAGLVATRLLPRSELFGFGREQIYELLSDADQRRS